MLEIVTTAIGAMVLLCGLVAGIWKIFKGNVDVLVAELKGLRTEIHGLRGQMKLMVPRSEVDTRFHALEKDVDRLHERIDRLEE